MCKTVTKMNKVECKIVSKYGINLIWDEKNNVSNIYIGLEHGN